MVFRNRPRKVYRSSFHIQLGGSRHQSVDEGSVPVEFHVDPSTKKLVKEKSVTEKIPEFITKPRRQFINNGEVAKFKTSFEDSSTTKLIWSKDGKVVASDNRIKIFQEKDNHFLEIQKVTPDDQGTYTCTIQNSAGSDSASAELEIFVKPAPHGKKSVFLPPTVDVPLEDTEFANGEKDACLTCKFSNGIDGRATWMKDGRELGSWQAKTTFDGRTARLTLREAQKRNCGVYECIVKNSGGDAKSRCLVSLLDPKVKPTPPKFKVTLADQTIETGEKLVLETEVEGLPRPSLKWYKDNTELGSSQDIRMEYKDGKGRLIVDKMSADEASTFTCVAVNVAGKDQTQAAVKFEGSEELREPPIFTKELHDTEINDGDRVELGVEVKGSPPIEIVWVHNNREIPATDPVCRIVADGNSRKLIIPEVFPEDEGEYVCEAYNDYGDTDTFCRLVVREKQNTPDINSFPPEFIIRPQQTSVTKGNCAIFTTQVSGHPPPTLVWYKGKEWLKQGRKYKIHGKGDVHNLEVTSATITDADDYTCLLSNALGEAKCVATLQVGETTPSSSAPTDFRIVPNSKNSSSHIERTNSTKSEPAKFSLEKNMNRDNTMDLSSRKSSAPTVEKKGGVNQVDFRGVLKKTGTTAQSPIAPKSKGVETGRNKKELDFRNVLSHKPHPRADVSQSKQVTSSRPIPNGQNVGKATKTELVLAPEAVETGKQVDFRSVLKKGKSFDQNSSKEKNDWSTSIVKLTKTKSSSPIPVIDKNEKPSSADRPKEERKQRPSFVNDLEDRSVEYGSKVVMECTVDGLPEPDITWSFKDMEIKKSKYFRMSYENHVARFVIDEAFSDDEGAYTCTASNTAGSTTKSCNLHVEEPPKPEELPSDEEETEEEEILSPDISPPKIYDISPSIFSIQRGGTMEFRVSYSAVPAADVNWLQNRISIKSAGHMKVDTTEHFSTLTIYNVQSTDSGRYDVTVTNCIGVDTVSASLTVEDVPDPPVGQPSVCDVTKTSATLSWYGPAYDGGCPITNYRVEICDAEDQLWMPVTSSCHNTTYHIKDLIPDTPYFFRVFAENRHGVSQPCQTSEVTVTTDRRPSVQRTLSIDSDAKTESKEKPLPKKDVFVAEVTEATTPCSEYDLVSPLSPDEIAFEHREVTMTPGRIFDDHYDTFEEVGKGKFGSVFRCKDKTTDKVWAAKIIKCREAEKSKLRLEVEIMNQLKHPKILMLWDVFEVSRKMILVMEFIGGGELFERVLDEDFELTEHDCIQFMRQIGDGVQYMHCQNILHLDLKPENILCIKNESNKIKIIDFGLARFYKAGQSTRVMFGTPEFIAPEVVNYEEIGFQTDMWSLGVICYVLLSGLSPFMGDSDSETLSNVTQGDFDFEDESFENISTNAKTFIENLLLKNKRKRLTAQQCLEHPWLVQSTVRTASRKINTKNLKRFMARRKWQKTGTAIRALGRMRSFQKLLKSQTSSNSSTSDSATPLSPCLTPVTSAMPFDLSSASVESDSVSKADLEEDPNRVRARNDGISEEQCDQNTVRLSDLKTDVNSNDRTKNHNRTSDVTPSKCSPPVNQNTDGAKLTNEKLSSSEATPTNSESSAAETRLLSNDNSDNSESNTNSAGSPVFIKEMIDSKAFPGDSVRFDVVTSGKPEPQIEWYFEDELLSTDDPRNTILEGENGQCSLIIKAVTEDDDGEYSCSAINNFGEANCSAELIVYGAI